MNGYIVLIDLKGVYMAKKKWIYIVLVLIFCIIVGIVIFKNIDIVDTKNENEVIMNDYIPEEEISDEQNRLTIVTLYFVNPASGELIPEARKLDAKELLENPYEKVINFLIDGSENEQIGKTIPDGTTLNSVSLNGEELTIDLNENFIKDKDVKSVEFSNIVYSIVNTCLEFNDISSVRFLVNGEAVSGLEKSYSK